MKDLIEENDADSLGVDKGDWNSFVTSCLGGELKEEEREEVAKGPEDVLDEKHGDDEDEVITWKSKKDASAEKMQVELSHSHCT
jgi:hypothetical protein